MQPDRGVIAGYWLESARNDLTVAREFVERIPSVACFHAQQAAENALKALLVSVSGDAARTHVTSELVAELRAASVTLPDAIVVDVLGLDKFYAPTRYPDALGGGNPASAFTVADALAAHVTAERVYRHCAEHTGR